MPEPTIFGFSAKDILLALIGLIVGCFGFIFRSYDKRICALEKEKANELSVANRFTEVLVRLANQDMMTEKRDKKLDRILEAVEK